MTLEREQGRWSGRVASLIVKAIPAAVFVTTLAMGAQAAEQKLTAADGAANDFFSGSVAISGDTMVVGSPFDNVGSTHEGSAYVFIRNSGVWALQQKLTGSDGVSSPQFRTNWVAISGDTIVLGSPGDDAGAINQGAAHVFVRSDGVWTRQQTLIASGGAAGDGFGSAMAISGDTVVVSSPGDDNSRGSAYVFVRGGGVWSEQAKLTAGDGAALDGLGSSVAISGDTVVAGATSDDVGRGSAYVFVRSGGVWTQQQKLTAADRGVRDIFGFSVATSGDTIVVGSAFDDVGANLDQGSAYVFIRSGGVWTQQQKLIASDGAAGDQFGRVAIRGNTIIVGSPGDDVGANNAQGSVYVFVRRDGVWTEQHKLVATDGTAADFFGFSVAMSGVGVVVGAPGDTANQGAAYVYTRSAAEQLGEVADELEAIVDANPGTPLADKIEDVLAKVQAALQKLDQTPPDRQGAVGELEGAVGDLEAAVKDGLLMPAEGNALMDRIAGASRLLAEQAIAEAAADGGNAAKIAEAEQALAAGDLRRAAADFKDAVARYKDAVAKAEGA